MTERVCAWCGADISQMQWNAKYCSQKCARALRYAENPERYRAYVRKYRRKVSTGPFMEERACAFCGSHYIAKTSTAKFCSARCKEARRYEKDREKRCAQEKAYRAKNLDKVRESARARYCRMKEESPEKWQRFCAIASQASKEWRARDPKGARQKDLEWRRRRAAERALAILILDQPPET